MGMCIIVKSNFSVMQKPLVSIIIPVYKVEDYIERCLRSVINQTYSRLECILVDDCSPDNSVSIAKKVLAEFTFNAKFIFHHQNEGLSVTRNTGIQHATGKYLYFLDSDDEITPDAIKRLVEISEKYQAEITVGKNIVIDENGNHKDISQQLF